jgi:hypothetical protein
LTLDGIQRDVVGNSRSTKASTKKPYPTRCSANFPRWATRLSRSPQKPTRRLGPPQAPPPKQRGLIFDRNVKLSTRKCREPRRRRRRSARHHRPRRRTPPTHHPTSQPRRSAARAQASWRRRQVISQIADEQKKALQRIDRRLRDRSKTPVHWATRQGGHRTGPGRSHPASTPGKHPAQEGQTRNTLARRVVRMALLGERRHVPAKPQPLFLNLKVNVLILIVNQRTCEAIAGASSGCVVQS